MGIRIFSGVAKNRNLKSPNIPGIRLTQEVARQAIFSILGVRVIDAVCLDLFAGSGSLGIEALSRGAKECDFVDNNTSSTTTIHENIRLCEMETIGKVFTSDSLKYISTCGKKYDVIFMDPYYDTIAHRHIFKTLPMVMKPNSIVIFSHGKDADLENLLEGSGLILNDQRHYGASIISFLSIS